MHVRWPVVESTAHRHQCLHIVFDEISDAFNHAICVFGSAAGLLPQISPHLGTTLTRVFSWQVALLLPCSSPKGKLLSFDVCGKPHFVEEGLSFSRWHRKSSVQCPVGWLKSMSQRQDPTVFSPLRDTHVCWFQSTHATCNHGVGSSDNNHGSTWMAALLSALDAQYLLLGDVYHVPQNGCVQICQTLGVFSALQPTNKFLLVACLTHSSLYLFYTFKIALCTYLPSKKLTPFQLQPCLFSQCVKSVPLPRARTLSSTSFWLVFFIVLAIPHFLELRDDASLPALGTQCSIRDTNWLKSLQLLFWLCSTSMACCFVKTVLTHTHCHRNCASNCGLPSQCWLALLLLCNSASWALPRISPDKAFFRSVKAWYAVSGITFLSSPGLCCSSRLSTAFLRFPSLLFFPWDIPTSDLLLHCCHNHSRLRNLVLCLEHACPACFPMILSSDRILQAWRYPRHQDHLVSSAPQLICSADIPSQQPPSLEALAARSPSAFDHPFAGTHGLRVASFIVLRSVEPYAGAQSLRAASFIVSVRPLNTTAWLSAAFFPSSSLSSSQLGCFPRLSIHHQVWDGLLAITTFTAVTPSLAMVVAKTFSLIPAREPLPILWLQRASCSLKKNGCGATRWNCAHSIDTQAKGQALSQRQSLVWLRYHLYPVFLLVFHVFTFFIVHMFPCLLPVPPSNLICFHFSLMVLKMVNNPVVVVFFLCVWQACLHLPSLWSLWQTILFARILHWFCKFPSILLLCLARLASSSFAVDSSD